MNQRTLRRTGKSFCSDWDEVIPDIYIMGKALGGGVYPVAAVAADAEIFDVLEPGSHGTTYGANPLACAVALAALGVVEQENLSQRSCELGEYFTNGLRKLRGSAVKEVRGVACSSEWNSPGQLKRIVSTWGNRESFARAEE